MKGYKNKHHFKKQKLKYFFYQMDCLEGMTQLEDNSIDLILTDPPYLYLKGQKLDRPFNEKLFFKQCYRLLKDDGFIVLFGRGTSFYRWNTLLHKIGFVFKEEVIWYKSYVSSPFNALHRVHETISIHTKKNGTIRKVKVSYLENVDHSLHKIHTDLKRIMSSLPNAKGLENLKKYLEGEEIEKIPETKSKYQVTGKLTYTIDRAVSTLKGIEEGIIEKSIIKVPREHYATIHPTQKPVDLLIRLLMLTSCKKHKVLDPFAGSFSCAEACFRKDRNFIGFEIDKEFFDKGVQRAIEFKNNETLF